MNAVFQEILLFFGMAKQQQQETPTVLRHTLTGKTLCRPPAAYLMVTLCTKCSIVGKYLRGWVAVETKVSYG